MITEENKSHDIYLIKEVVTSVFNELKSKYGFEDYVSNFKNLYGETHIGIKKNEIIIYSYISIREAYEINFLKAGEERWRRKTWNSLFLDKLPPFSKKNEEFLKEKNEKMKRIEKYSFEWYYLLISDEIQFAEKYYPQIFELGKL